MIEEAQIDEVRNAVAGDGGHDVLRDALGFEQVVACVEITNVAPHADRVDPNAGRRGSDEGSVSSRKLGGRGCDLLAHFGEILLCLARLRVSGAEDPQIPLNHVLHDSLGYEQVVACVEIKYVSAPPRERSALVIQNAGRRGSRAAGHWLGYN